jgi:polyferredoxin
MVLQEIKDFYKSIFDDNKENFGDKKTKATLILVLAFVTLIFLQLFVGKYLWNNYLTKLVPAINPAEGMIDILAISLLFRLLFN